MMMTELEIVTTFRHAKYPGKQVAILAELNSCSTEEIKEILLRNGVEQKNLPRKSRKMRQAEMEALVESSVVDEPAEETTVAAPVPEEAPLPDEAPVLDENILDLIRREEASAASEYRSLQAQMEALADALTAAERRLADIRTAQRALERYYGLDVEPEENPDFYCSEGERSEVND